MKKKPALAAGVAESTVTHPKWSLKPEVAEIEASS